LETFFIRGSPLSARSGRRFGGLKDQIMETPDSLLERAAPLLAAVPGVVAVVVGGSRATGAAHAASDTDIGLYFSEGAGWTSSACARPCEIS
jgi:hypothetical protein